MNIYIKSLLLVSTIIISLFTPLYSADKVDLYITVEDDKDNKADIMILGCHEDATYHLDEEIGEKSIPNLPPPYELAAWLVFKDSVDNSNIYTRTEYIPFPVDKKQILKHRYTVKYNRADDGDDIFIKWSFDDKRIISAVITDGGVNSADMKSENSFIMEWQKFINTVYIDVEYDLSSSSVSKNQINNVFVYPNPTNDILNIDVNYLYDNLIIYDNKMKLIKKFIANDTYDISEFSKGTYFVYLYRNRKLVGSVKLIKN